MGHKYTWFKSIEIIVQCLLSKHNRIAPKINTAKRAERDLWYSFCEWTIYRGGVELVGQVRHGEAPGTAETTLGLLSTQGGAVTRERGSLAEVLASGRMKLPPTLDLRLLSGLLLL